MATWEQGINAGGFLAGMGGNNQNAPQASDVNATLGFIRDNNEFARAGGNNVAIQGLQGLAGLSQQYKEQQQQQRQGEFQKAYGAAFQSGDRAAMRVLAAQYPEQFEAVQKGMGFIDDDHRNTIGTLATSGQLAATQGPEGFASWLKGNASELQRVGINPGDVATMYQQNPEGFQQLAGNMAMFSLGPEKAFEVQDKMVGRDIDRSKLAETIRSNQAGEGLQAQQIAVSRENSMRSARAGAGASTPASVREYQYFNSLSPEQQKTYLRVRGRPDAGGDNTVQLADGRTVNVSGKLHGSGANAFYEGTDDAGNMVRVPASAISAPPTSAATAQNYAMKKDLNAILEAPAGGLGFMTGITGGNGSPSWDAEVRSRFSGGDQRQLFNATKRIQGKMQNQGIAAARDMGASGINTVAEAKMYFQGMPQVDYSSPESMQQSVRDIQEYTDNYNQQYNVDIGNQRPRTGSATQQAPATQPMATGVHTSKSGIQFKVE